MVPETIPRAQFNEIVEKTDIFSAVTAATHSSAYDTGRVQREPARVHSRSDCAGKHGPVRRLEGLLGVGRIRSRPPGSESSGRGTASASARPSCDRTAEEMAAGNSSGRDWAGTSGRLPGRIHLSIQSPHLQISRQTVLSIGSASRAGRTCSVCSLGQTATACIWWRQVNTPIRKYESVPWSQSCRGGLKISRSTVSSSASALCGICDGITSTSPARTTTSRSWIWNFNAPSRT